MSKHYYTIGEVSNLLDLKPHVIRYWEKEIPAIRPKRSGRDRRYTLEQIETLKIIKDLLYNQRFTIKGAKQKLKGDRSILEEARQEAVAKQKLKVDAALPAIARDISQIRESLLKIKRECKKLSGNK
ncbi:MAG TPA: MerR family transcriptional regulator [Candidatus Cloacimonetes bacterium]|nr:MerR family transcriptional regulator [Candidatus Cloacimonadota bacterium]